MICICDEMLDRMLSQERGNTLAVLLAIQLMLGRKEHISVQSLIGKAGIKSTYINKYVQKLEEVGLLKRKRTFRNNKFGGVEYRLTNDGLFYLPGNTVPAAINENAIALPMGTALAILELHLKTTRELQSALDKQSGQAMWTSKDKQG